MTATTSGPTGHWRRSNRKPPAAGDGVEQAAADDEADGADGDGRGAVGSEVARRPRRPPEHGGGDDQLGPAEPEPGDGSGVKRHRAVQPPSTGMVTPVT